VTPDDTNALLDRLNASERELMLLLGQGHTAKSIATLKGLSELAVNERFRSARRKTGIGSSREIARLLAARENRDDFIGLAEPAAAPASLPRQDAPRGASIIRRWSLPMTAAGLLLATAIFAQQTSVPPAPPADDRVISSAAEAMFEARQESPDVIALHAEVGSGGPDPVWSATTETELSRIYHSIPAFSEAVASLDVTCNATLCEMLGVSRPNLSADQTDTLVKSVQLRDLVDIAARMKLKLVVQSFNTRRDDSGPAATTLFVTYWRRQP
jgi:DNA-binding CsgD family transcriptional regulator